MALPLLILSPLYRIEIQRLPAERIGHLALEPELFLCTRHTRAADPLPSLRSPFANPFLCQCGVGYYAPAHPGYWVLPSTRASASLGNVSARGWDRGHFDLRPLDDLAPHVKFTKGEKEEGIQLLAYLGVPIGRPYVCLAVRDDAYLAATAPTKDWSYHDTGILKSPTMPRWLSGSLALDTQFCVWVRTLFEATEGRTIPSSLIHAFAKWRSDR